MVVWEGRGSSRGRGVIGIAVVRSWSRSWSRSHVRPGVVPKAGLCCRAHGEEIGTV